MKLANKTVRVVQVTAWNTPAAIVFLLLAALCGGGVAGYQYGIRELPSVQQQRQQLEDELSEAQSEMGAMVDRLAGAELESSVSKGAMVDLQVSLESLQLELTQIKEEISRYKALLAPDSLERGLQVGSFKILGTLKARTFRFELLLTQIESKRSTLSGTVSIDIVAEYQGKSIVVPLPKVQKVDYYPLPYSFRYFQDFAGEVALPPGYKPLRTEVTLVPAGRGAKKIRRTFPWVVEAD